MELEQLEELAHEWYESSKRYITTSLDYTMDKCSLKQLKHATAEVLFLESILYPILEDEYGLEGAREGVILNLDYVLSIINNSSKKD